MKDTEVRVIGLSSIPLITKGDDLGKIICNAADRQGLSLKDGDIIVVTQKIVSKAEGRVYKLINIQPSPLARKIARRSRKSPELIELILRDAQSLVRLHNGHIITETRQGWICANAGVDVSNVSGGDSAALLPLDPDESAKRVRKRIMDLLKIKVAVIISDTFGRPFRLGHTDVGIGSSGIQPLFDMRGERDLYGYVLRVKQTAVIDELASAAELVIGNADEKIPVAIIRGYHYHPSEAHKATELVMPRARNLFL
jgi:coenzyme F420-0:L-glutamate ligase/coenzyme F420-1:gamma-L-glutamate ligase